MTKRKIDGILTEILINKEYKQSNIAEKVGVSQSYVSLVSRRLNQIKYLPRIENNTVKCLECGEASDLCIHQDHDTGRPIAVVCRKCNHKEFNKTVFENGTLSNKEFSGKVLEKGNFLTISLDDELVDAVSEKWKKKHPYHPSNMIHIIRMLLIKFIENGKLDS